MIVKQNIQRTLFQIHARMTNKCVMQIITYHQTDVNVMWLINVIQKWHISKQSNNIYRICERMFQLVYSSDISNKLHGGTGSQANVVAGITLYLV